MSKPRSCSNVCCFLQFFLNKDFICMYVALDSDSSRGVVPTLVLLWFSECFFLFLGVLPTFKPRSCSNACSVILLQMLWPWGIKVMVHQAEYDLSLYVCLYVCMYVCKQANSKASTKSPRNEGQQPLDVQVARP